MCVFDQCEHVAQKRASKSASCSVSKNSKNYSDKMNNNLTMDLDGIGHELSIKRSPEEIVRQLQVTQKKRSTNLVSSEKQLEAYKNENLELKLQIYNMKNSQRNIESVDVENEKEDIVYELIAQNEELRKELEERDRREKKDARRKKSMQTESSCQTNLDSFNIEELFRARRELEKIKQQELFQRPTTDPMRQSQPIIPTSASLHNHLSHHPQQTLPKQQVLKLDKETQFPIVSQLIYPHVTLPRTSNQKSNRQEQQLAPDEKVTLEKLFHLDGVITTIKDKMLARLDTSRIQ